MTKVEVTSNLYDAQTSKLSNIVVRFYYINCFKYVDVSEVYVEVSEVYLVTLQSICSFSSVCVFYVIVFNVLYSECPKPVNYLPLILGIVFGLLLLGLLLLLLWRALISLKVRQSLSNRNELYYPDLSTSCLSPFSYPTQYSHEQPSDCTPSALHV